jgi:hypothetical protein
MDGKLQIRLPPWLPGQTFSWTPANFVLFPRRHFDFRRIRTLYQMMSGPVGVVIAAASLTTFRAVAKFAVSAIIHQNERP